jgi:prepilin-type N-terminal cleavage/methylation domain-containing protein/prepilin-type processing-associated H-X9-DG protein
MKRKAGFTIIEILAVVTIITVILAIVIPIVSQGKAKAQQTSCLSNQKQLYAAHELYLADSDGLFPVLFHEPVSKGEPLSTWHNWRVGITPYLKADLKCPQSTATSNIVPNFQWGYCLNYYTHSYRYDSNLRYHTFLPRSINSVSVPSRAVLFSECIPSMTVSSSPHATNWSLLFFVAQDLFESYKHTPPATIKHSGRGNYTMMDGSVKLLLPDQMDGQPYYFNFPLKADSE